MIGLTLVLNQACGMLGNDGAKKSGQTKGIDTSFKKEPKNLSEGKQLEFDSRLFEAIKHRHIGNLEKAIKLLKRCEDIKPTEPVVYYELSKIYNSRNKLDKALTHAKEAVKYGGDQYWYLRNLANIYKARKAYKEGAKVMEKIIKKHDAGPRFYFRLANMYIRQQNLDKALGVYDRFEDAFGQDPQVIKQKKRIYLRQNKVEKAANEIRDLIEEHPNNLKYYRQLADIYKANGKNEKALDVYEQMLEIKPGDGQTQMALAGHYYRKGKKEKAFNFVKKAFSNPNLPVDKKVKFMLSKYVKQGGNSQKKQEAFKLAKILVETHPDQAKSHALYGDLLYQNDRVKEAREEYQKSLKYKKDNFSVWQNLLQINYQLNQYEVLKTKSQKALTYFPNQPIVYFYNGMAHKELGNLKKAAEQLEAGSNLVINNENLKSRFYSNLAMTYHDLKKYDLSDEYFEKALSLNPNDPFILNNYSWYLALRGERLEKAKKMSKKSLKLRPNTAAYLDTYGWIMYRQGNYQKAKEYVGRALEKSPEDPELLEHYGDILYKMGKENKAVKYWKKAKTNGGDQENLDKKITQRKIID